MVEPKDKPASGVILEEAQLSLGQIASSCCVHAEFLMELVDEGIIEPLEPQSSSWRFEGHCLKRVQRVVNLQRDLGVNLPGAALALDLLQQVEALECKVRQFRGR